MPKPVILLTDYGTQDPYAGILRGVIRSISPQTEVFDLTHGCSPQNFRQAAYYLDSSYRYFPKGSIFVCVVDPGVGTSRKIVCLKTKDYCFLAPDNGLLTLIYIKEGGKLRSVANSKLFLPSISNTFHGRDIFAPVAARLSRQDIFKSLGPEIRSIVTLKDYRPKRSEKALTGKIVYFDHFGNAISNIHKKNIRPGFLNKLKVKCGKIPLGGVDTCYNLRKKLIAVWNSADYLEIARPRGSAAESVKLNEKVTVIYE